MRKVVSGRRHLLPTVYMKILSLPTEPKVGLLGPVLNSICEFSCKRFVSFFKEVYNRLPCSEWIRLKGDSPTSANLPVHKQALKWVFISLGGVGSYCMEIATLFASC